ncbi:hypothetical protein GCM10025876_40410 [Demequina litorisediminis]|uniref:Uncharacterized protein n=1 Tax=Demequina litorisediminis TaxID=1849022 RepID=A0ABQ6IM60_9MICO|nr:hypothetical protein GCM10025876_40410 [Demequina litorisediminis]
MIAAAGLTISQTNLDAMHPGWAMISMTLSANAVGFGIAALWQGNRYEHTVAAMRHDIWDASPVEASDIVLDRKP